MTDIDVRAYWGPRAATLDEAARTVVAVADALAQVGEPFVTLYHARDRSRDPVRRFDRSLDAVRHELSTAGRTRNSIGGVMEDLGYSLSVNKNLRRALQSGFSIKIGTTWAQLLNYTFVTVDEDHAVVGDRGSMTRAILESVVPITDPDYGVVSSEALDALLNRSAADRPVGWLTYFSSRVLTGRKVPALPRPSSAWPTGGGVVVQATENVTDPSVPGDAVVVLDLQDRLRRAGLLTRR